MPAKPRFQLRHSQPPSSPDRPSAPEPPEVSKESRVCGGASVAQAFLCGYRSGGASTLVLDLVPLEERHRCQIEDFEDRLDQQTVYLRYGCAAPAELRKTTAWLERQWNTAGQDRFSQGAFLNLRLIGIGSIYKSRGAESAETALVVDPEFQGFGHAGEKGVGGLLLDDLIRYARDEQLDRVTASFATSNPRCERLLRKYGFSICSWSYLNQEGTATLDLHQLRGLPKAA